MQFKNVENYDNYILDDAKSKLVNSHSYDGIYENNDRKNVNSSNIVGYIEGSRRDIMVYKKN